MACGDRVTVARTAGGQGVIEAVAPRATLLYRSDRARQKLVAANVTQIVIVVAPVPAFDEDLVNRCLAAAEHGGMAALIALNKVDLPQAPAALRSLELYRGLGYRLVALSAKRDMGPLVSHLKGQTSVLVGQSGMGKSTIINGLLPAAAVRVAEISAALDSGRHTTTHTRLYHLDDVEPRHRLAGHAALRAASSGGARARGRLRRVPAVARAMPLPRLPPRVRARLRHRRSLRQGKNQRAPARVLPRGDGRKEERES